MIGMADAIGIVVLSGIPLLLFWLVEVV